MMSPRQVGVEGPPAGTHHYEEERPKEHRPIRPRFVRGSPESLLRQDRPLGMFLLLEVLAECIEFVLGDDAANCEKQDRIVASFMWLVDLDSIVQCQSHTRRNASDAGGGVQTDHRLQKYAKSGTRCRSGYRGENIMAKLAGAVM